MLTRPLPDPLAPTSSRRGARVATLTTLVLSIPLTGVFSGTAYADAAAGPGAELKKISICHATGSATNPFVFITPSKNGVLNGHVGHQDADDIIPPFSYRDHGTVGSFPGQNATAANLALLDAGKCPAPAAPPVVVPPAPEGDGDANDNDNDANDNDNDGNNGNKNGKVTICHATGNGSFRLISPNKNGVLHGHVGHQDGADIIPPFTYDDHGNPASFPGQNATPANLALLDAGKCPAPAAPPVVVVPPPVVVVPPPVVVVPPAPAVVPPAPVVAGPPAPVDVVPPSVSVVTPPISTENGGGSGVVVPTAVTFPVTSLGGGSTAPALGSGTVSPAAVGPAALPFTGADTGLLAELSLLLIFTGAGAVVLGRNRTALRNA